MKTINEIIEQYTPYSKSIATWDREDIHSMIKEYAIEVLDHLMSSSEEYIYIDTGEEYMNDEHIALFKYEAMEKLKQQIQDEQ